MRGKAGHQVISGMVREAEDGPKDDGYILDKVQTMDHRPEGVRLTAEGRQVFESFDRKPTYMRTYEPTSNG